MICLDSLLVLKTIDIISIISATIRCLWFKAIEPQLISSKRCKINFDSTSNTTTSRTHTFKAQPITISASSLTITIDEITTSFSKS